MVPSISKRIPKKVWEVGLPVKAEFSCKGIVMVFESSSVHWVDWG